MEQPDLIIKNCNLGKPRWIEGDMEATRAFCAPGCLEDFYRYNHAVLMKELGFTDEPAPVKRMMAVLPYVAEYYGMDKNDLLQQWTSEFGMMHMMREDK